MILGPKSVPPNPSSLQLSRPRDLGIPQFPALLPHGPGYPGSGATLPIPKEVVKLIPNLTLTFSRKTHAG